MGAMDYMLAQVNVGRLLAPVDSPLIADFVAALDSVNAAADAAPGFVWRMQTEDGNATAVRGFERDASDVGGRFDPQHRHSRPHEMLQQVSIVARNFNHKAFRA